VTYSAELEVSILQSYQIDQLNRSQILPLAAHRKEVLWFEDFRTVVHKDFQCGWNAPAAVKSKSGITRFARPPALIPFFS
jgi:hypothetical protein